ncbi:hypothetical protein Pd630_LPD05827 [Rhodococcus opacus PD630]|nr:hypothetical protein Pd630_LPD05827 [Rhodococcus opacus PD630]
MQLAMTPRQILGAQLVDGGQDQELSLSGRDAQGSCQEFGNLSRRDISTEGITG